MAPGKATQVVDPFQDRVFRRLAKSGERLNTVLLTRLFQFVDRFNLQFFIDDTDLFGAQSGNLQKIEQAFRDETANLLLRFTLPFQDPLLDQARQSFADSLN